MFDMANKSNKAIRAGEANEVDMAADATGTTEADEADSMLLDNGITIVYLLCMMKLSPMKPTRLIPMKLTRPLWLITPLMPVRSLRLTRLIWPNKDDLDDEAADTNEAVGAGATNGTNETEVNVINKAIELD